MDNTNQHRDEVAEELRELAREVAEERIAPRAADLDRQRAFPWDNVRDLAAADLMGLVLPEEHGGLAADRTCLVAVTEEIARACGSTALVYVSHLAAAKAVAAFHAASKPSNCAAWAPNGLWCWSMAGASSPAATALAAWWTWR